MLLFFVCVVPAALALTCRAACLAPLDAAFIADTYRRLVSNYSDALAAQYLADDFTERSDSINTLAQLPLSSATFASKQAFMDAQESQAPFPMAISSIDAVDCTVIALRWTATFGAADLPARGITILTTTDAAGYWQISAVVTEFNSLIWLKDMGGSYTLVNTISST